MRTFLTLFFTLCFQFVGAQPKYQVYVFYSETCPICQYQVKELKRNIAEYSDFATFTLVFPSKLSTDKKVEDFQEKYGLSLPFKLDADLKLTRKLGATITPEVFIVNEKEEVVYQGLMDNSYAKIGKRRTIVTQFQLYDNLKALQNNQPLAYVSTNAVGCIIQQ